MYNKVLNFVLVVSLVFAVTTFLFILIALDSGQEQKQVACVRSNGEVFSVQNYRIGDSYLSYVTHNGNEVTSFNAEFVLIDKGDECSVALFR